MVAAAPDKTTKQFVLDWINDGVESGMTLAEAAEDALSEVLRLGKAEQLLKDLGPTVIVDYWRHHNQSARASAFEGKRRVDTEQLGKSGALMEALYMIDGVPRRLGDLSFYECEYLKQDYSQRARDNAKKAEFFARIAAKLEGGQTVRDALSEQQLRSFVEESESE